MKRFITSALINIPMFLFCVLFVMGYNTLFGAENTVIGITILTALFIFLKNDLGYAAPQAALSIGGMLLLAVTAPKIAAIHPFLGLPVNFAAILLILILSSHEVQRDCHVPFLLGYAFASGYPVSGAAFTARIVSVLAGAVLVGGIYYLRNRGKGYELTVPALFRGMTLQSANTRWYLKLATVMTLVMFLGDLLHYPNTLWVNFTVLSLTYHTEEVRVKRTKWRLPATVLGSLVFLLIYDLLVPPQYHSMVILATGFVMMFVSDYAPKTGLNSFSALSSAMLVFGTQGAVLLRVISNAIGLVIATVNHAVFSKAYSRMIPAETLASTAD